MPDPTGPTVVVLGGGIAGLAAAWELSRSPERPRVVVLEASERLGGKIHSGELAGAPVEWGPDAFLARHPHAVGLCRELGLGEELVSPATGGAYLWSRGRLRRLPAGQVMGVPTNLRQLARSGVVGPIGVMRAGLDLVLPAPRRAQDASVGQVVRARLGAQVQERLVDPLVGGIHAGRSDQLSIAATAPQLDTAWRAGRSLMRSLRPQAATARAAAATGRSAPPVFLSHPRGLGHVVDVLAARLAEAGVDLRLGCAAVGLDRVGAGGRRWSVAAAGEALEADGVVVALPAHPAAELLSAVCPSAARALAAIQYSSVVVTTFAFGSEDLPEHLDGTGFLVPRPEGRLMTAATWMSAKWAHVRAPGVSLVRVSAGRHLDERAMDLDDTELADRLADELAQAMGLRAGPRQLRVTRWVDGFPQYGVGHLQRVDALEAEVAGRPGLAVAGAAYRGVGLPACIDSGRRAAGRLLAQWPTADPVR